MHLNVQYFVSNGETAVKRVNKRGHVCGVWKAVRRVRLMMIIMMTVIVDAVNQRQTLTSSGLQRSIVRR